MSTDIGAAGLGIVRRLANGRTCWIVTPAAQCPVPETLRWPTPALAALARTGRCDGQAVGKAGARKAWPCTFDEGRMRRRAISMPTMQAVSQAVPDAKAASTSLA